MTGSWIRPRGASRLAAVASLLLAVAGCAPKDSATATPQSPTWSISGTVSGAISAGVTVKIQGSNKSVVTKSDGTYTIFGLYDRSYTLEALRPGYAFTPPTRTVTVSGANVTGQDFASRVGIAISGSITGGAPAGVTVTLVGPAPSTTATTATTGATGTFTFDGLTAGVYSVTPTLAGGWTFVPANSLVTVATTSVSGPTFTAIAPAHAISGRVAGAVTAGVSVTLSGAADGVAVTDATGNYAFTGLAAGDYTVSPSRSGFAFTPASLSVTLASVDVTGQDFVAAAVYRVGGWVTGDVLDGVTVSLTPVGGTGDTWTTTTEPNGHFQITGLLPGSYDVTPSLSGYTFSPPTRRVSIVAADVTNANYAATLAPAYSVSGLVAGPPGVTMTLQGATELTATTDATGAFTIPAVPSGSYMLIPTLPDYLFDPASRVVTMSGANVTGQAFTASLSPSARTISGVVSGNAISGVTVSLTGVAPATPTVTTTTDATGRFAFRGLADGLYQVTLSLAGGYAFTPADCLVTVNGPSVTDLAFTSAAVPHTISGKVSGAVAAGVFMVLEGDATDIVQTAPDGSYAFGGLPSGSYTVTPFLGGYVFGPSASEVTLQGADALGVNFVAAATHTISGRISGTAGAGVKVTLSGVAAADVTTDPGGYYEFRELVDGTYVLTPALDGYTFSPELRAVALSGADMTTADFLAVVVPTWSVSGRVSGAVLVGVTITLSGAATATTTTDATGFYVFNGLDAGSYMLIPSITGHTFAPASRAFSIRAADVAGQDFTAGP